MKLRAILLAAGQGTRMKSSLPKLLHPLAGKPMLLHSLEAVSKVSDEKPVLVVGHEAEAIKDAAGDAHYVLQKEQLGTGHAVLQARDSLKGRADLILVLNADMPLLRPETLQQLVAAQQENDGPFSMLTVKSDAPRGFGRILRGDQNQVLAIIEEAEASPEELEIKELNVGGYCFQSDWLWEHLDKLHPSANKGEYYLTDLVELAAQAGARVQALLMDDLLETIGINTRVHLAQAEAALRQRINESLMLAGVTITDPSSTYIDVDVEIGHDSIILPNTYIQGQTTIGENCTIGPNSMIRDAMIGHHCLVKSSSVEEAVMENHVNIGPYAHLRKGAHLEDHVHMGNFGEIKNSHLGQGVKVGHFSYLGDATIGPNVNIGAGTITVNYDGENKHPTVIGADVFIGSDSMLVAPLKIGEGARTGAGSVVTKDVKAYTLVVGVPARAIRKLEKDD